MNCADFEILLCDYVDGTLEQSQRSELEAHQRECAACAELARDVAGAVAFMERVPDVEPPHELLAKIGDTIRKHAGDAEAARVVSGAAS